MSTGHGTSEKSTDDYDALGRIFRACDTTSKGSAAVVALIHYMRQSMSLYGGYDGSPEILEELQSKLVRTACRNGEVTWDQFHESSQRWLREIRLHRLHSWGSRVTEQDGNNNFDADRSENLELELEPNDDLKHSTTDRNEEDDDEECHRDGILSPIRDDPDAMSVGFLDSSTVSNYSTSTVNTTRCESPNDHSILRSFVAPDGNGDDQRTTGESSAEIVELRAKIRRVTAENADLRDGLQRDEEAIDSLQQRLADLQRILAQRNERCNSLEKDNAEQKELLSAAERNIELLKVTTQRCERERRKAAHLAKRIEELEAERQRWTIESEQLRRTNKEMTKRIADYQIKLDEEHALRDEQERHIVNLRADNQRWREAHRVLEDTNQHLRDAVKELETGLSESRMNQGSFAVFGSLNFGLKVTPDHIEDKDNDHDYDHEEDEEEGETEVQAATHHPVATGRGFGRSISYSLHDELKATPPLMFALGERKDAATQLCLDAISSQDFPSTKGTMVYPSSIPYAESSIVRGTPAIPWTERTHRHTSATSDLPDRYQSRLAWRSPDKPYGTSSEDESSEKIDSSSTSIGADGGKRRRTESRPNNESSSAKDDDIVGRRAVLAVKVEDVAPERNTSGPESATPERDRRVVVPAIFPGSYRPPTLGIIAPAPTEITEFQVCCDDVAGFTRRRCRYDRENSTESASVARAMSTGEDSSDCDSSRRDDEPAAAAAAAASTTMVETPERTRASLITVSTVTAGPSRIPGSPVASSSPREIGIASSLDDDADVGMLPSSRAHHNLLSSDELSFANERERNDGIEEPAERSTTQRKECERARRSLSEGDSGGPNKRNSECGLTMVESTNGTTTDEERVEIFPSLSDRRLLDLGLSSIPGTPNAWIPSLQYYARPSSQIAYAPGPTSEMRMADFGNGRSYLTDTMNEDDLERKYTALSLGLETDRITMDRRVALGRRQRDQAERNLDAEVGRTRRDVQALAPLCVDRESVERVERVKHQLEMIARCAHRVSSTAELLGAVHQERRVSRAALLADRYLQSLRAKCDKLATELAETKRILSENHIVVEETASELGDEVPSRVRYRGLPTSNRTTMTRRRASIAAISRPLLPLGISTEMTKTTDNGKQRNPNTGRIPARRPSLSYDVQKWDYETLDRTDSSSSIGELREIFEQAESRRSSRDENSNSGNHNGLFRSQSSNFSVGSCESADSDVWAIPREDSTPDNADELLSIAESGFGHRRRQILKSLEEYVAGVPVMWCLFLLVAFLFGYYSRHRAAVDCAAPYKWWSIEEILRRYLRMQRYGPPPV